jgi:hypothetical protein
VRRQPDCDAVYVSIAGSVSIVNSLDVADVVAAAEPIARADASAEGQGRHGRLRRG